MHKYLLTILLFTAVAGNAQIPEDALRYSFFPQNGTARNQAIGGAMGSLGGDITTLFVNPAGLGNYRTGEVVFTPNFFMNNNRTDFRDTRFSNKKNSFSIGPLGIAYGTTSPNDPKNSMSIAFGVMQLANYNNRVQYRGYNNYSSYAEQWAESFAKSNLTIDGALNAPAFAYGTAPALYTYLVDTFTLNGQTLIKATPEFLLESGQALLQENTIETKGGLYEVALGFAGNKNDKWLYGGSIGIPIMDYENTTTFNETDTSSNTTNGFGYLKYMDHYTTSGVGLNLKFGVIYKPRDYIRIGLALHTPTYMFTLKDRRNTTLDVNTENLEGVRSITSETFTNNLPGESQYSLLTPWKAMISGSYVFREIADVTKQKGFITADIEYVNHRGSRFYSANEQPTEDEKGYYKDLNSVIKNQYKGNFNFRVGGELKFNIVMARLGFAYYANPYKDSELKANRMLLSGGLGYRNKGFFVDLTYVHSINKDVNFPYRLGDKDNTFAETRNTRGNVVASVGFKF